MIDQIIAFNKTFVGQKGYEKYLTSKYPDKKRILWFVVLSSTLKREHWKR
jgi:hypothetical protein